MMTLRLEPNAYDLARYFDVPETRIRLDRKTLLAAAAVGAAFAALGLYFATQRFILDAPVIDEPGTIRVNTYTPPKETKPRVVTETPPPPPPSTPFRAPEVTPAANVEVAPVTGSTTPTDAVGPVVAMVEPIVGPTAPAVEPAPPRRLPPSVVRPDWLRQPSSADISRFYPDRGIRLGREGQAVLSCTVTASGGLSACTVAAETPAGFGFGRAAMEMTSLFRMRPQTEDGTPVGGAKVNVPVNFRLR